MSIPIAEIRAAALLNTNYDKSLGGHLYQFYQTTGNPSRILEGLEPEWFKLMGFPISNLHNQWDGFLQSYGFTGDLKSNILLEADARHLFPQYVIPDRILLEDGGYLLQEDGSFLFL